VIATLDVPVADFERLAHSYLIVDGLVCGCDSYPCTDKATGTHTHPDPDLVALVGKACDDCAHAAGVIPDPRYGRSADRWLTCPECLGSGSALLTVTTDVCPSCLGESALISILRCDDCDDYGTGSVRVRLTGQPLPIVDGATWVERPYVAIVVRAFGVFHFGPDDESGDVSQPVEIDLGGDPAALIGRWAFPVEVVTGDPASITEREAGLRNELSRHVDEAGL
jgi:hypothetical protein